MAKLAILSSGDSYGLYIGLVADFHKVPTNLLNQRPVSLVYFLEYAWPITNEETATSPTGGVGGRGGVGCPRLRC